MLRLRVRSPSAPHTMPTSARGTLAFLLNSLHFQLFPTIHQDAYVSDWLSDNLAFLGWFASRQSISSLPVRIYKASRARSEHSAHHRWPSRRLYHRRTWD